MDSVDILKSLTCPITLEIFNEPVILSDGHTYEKSAIIKILKNNISFRYAFVDLILNFKLKFGFLKENRILIYFEMYYCKICRRFFHLSLKYHIKRKSFILYPDYKLKLHLLSF